MHLIFNQSPGMFATTLSSLLRLPVILAASMGFLFHGISEKDICRKPRKEEELIVYDPFMKSLEKDSVFSQRFRELNDTGITQSNIERSVIVIDRVNQQYNYNFGKPNETDNPASIESPIDGRLHNHYKGLTPVFSPQDVIALCEIYLAGFARDSANLFFGLTSCDGPPYIIKVASTAIFRRFAQRICGLQGDDTKRKQRFYESYEYVLRSGLPVKNETEFLKMILTRS